MIEKECQICGEKFMAMRARNIYCCDACRAEGKRRKCIVTSRKHYEKKKLSKMVRQEPGKLGMVQLNELARREGLSYGQYVAKMEQGRGK